MLYDKIQEILSIEGSVLSFFWTTFNVFKSNAAILIRNNILFTDDTTVQIFWVSVYRALQMQGCGQADEVLKYFKCKDNAAGAVPCERLPYNRHEADPDLPRPVSQQKMK